MTSPLPRPLHEWHEDHGDVLWWLWPIEQAPYVGSPLDLGRTVSFDVTIQIGVDVYEVEQRKVGDTGGWPWRDANEETEARLFWTPLPDCAALDEAIRDHIRGAHDPFKEDAALESCRKCDDSGYIEFVSGGIWTGENITTRHEICDCACGEDVRRELAAPTA